MKTYLISNTAGEELVVKPKKDGFWYAPKRYDGRADVSRCRLIAVHPRIEQAFLTDDGHLLRVWEPWWEKVRERRKRFVQLRKNLRETTINGHPILALQIRRALLNPKTIGNCDHLQFWFDVAKALGIKAAEIPARRYT